MSEHTLPFDEYGPYTPAQLVEMVHEARAEKESLEADVATAMFVNSQVTAQNVEFRAELDRLRAENEALRQLVRDAEWVGGSDEFGPQCPWCGGEQPTASIPGYGGHEPDCPARPFLDQGKK